jgi:lipopolysaccharide/colanic/teichoic acid biosynthesis glycosyltransferase
MNKIFSLLIYSSQKEGDVNASRTALKRMLDVIIAGLLVIALSPLLILISLMIKLDSNGPVIYKRRLLGYKGQEFNMLKFRTMALNSDDLVETMPHQEEFKKNHKLKDDPRITRVGRFLRKHSLDELPQLVNVLSGDMSLVGPRPIHPVELHHYDGQANLMQSIKPGMTGLWQVSGRSNLNYEERVRLDIFYVRNWSIRLDIELLLKTIPEVIKGPGAY